MSLSVACRPYMWSLYLAYDSPWLEADGRDVSFWMVANYIINSVELDKPSIKLCYRLQAITLPGNANLSCF